MAKPEIPESLQCLACAMRQEQGQVNETLLESYMLGIAGVRGGTQPPNNVMDALNIREDKVQNSWSTWPSKREDLDSYLTSCVLIANRIYDWLPRRKYIFHHANSLSSYKETYTRLARNVYDTTANNNVKAVYKEVSKAGADDKWNPADIIAVDSSRESALINSLENFEDVYLRQVRRDPRGSKLRKQNEAAAKRLDPRMQKRIHVMQEMEQIYEYNHWIDRLFKKRDLVGISLKKQASTSVPVKVFDHKDVKGIKESLELELVITDVKMEPQNKKAIVEFDLNGVSDGWKMDVRGGSSGIDKVQMQLQHGSQAAHGKASMSIFTLITKMSKGWPSVKRLKLERRNIFGNRNRNRTLGINYAIDIPSGRDFYAVNTDVFRDYHRSTRGKFSQGTWPLHLDMWAEYIAFLSGGDSNQDQILSQYRRIVGNNSDPLNGIRYIKDKVQSGEIGYVLDKESGIIDDAIKDNIMKGVYTYAGSKGFRIFGDKSVTDYMTSSTYVKVGGS